MKAIIPKVSALLLVMAALLVSASVAQATEPATVTVTRSGFQMLSLMLYVDGKPFAKLANDESKTFTIPPGDHYLVSRSGAVLLPGERGLSATCSRKLGSTISTAYGIRCGTVGFGSVQARVNDRSGNGLMFEKDNAVDPLAGEASRLSSASLTVIATSYKYSAIT